MDFVKLGINSGLVEGLKKVNITVPTNIQQRAIPLIKENKDVIAQSETGTGKTLAYLLPIFEKVDAVRRENQVIILTPTHELAIQVQRQIELLTNNSGFGITSTTIIGSVNIKRQIEQLKKKPQIIVGSPGRVLELITSRKIKAHTVKTIVVDEADRLLDKHNLEIVQSVIKTTQRDRQLLFFSATLSEQTVEIARELMKSPELLRVDSEVKIPENISHIYFMADQRDKIAVFRKIYGIIKPQKAIIFINQNYKIEDTVAKLNYHGFNVTGIHGSSGKLERKQVMDNFRSGRISILVASDLAARGLDIEDVTHIFNLDLPEDPQFFLHRSGRTGRAGKSGCTVSIVTVDEKKILHKYEKMFGIKITGKDLYKGNLVEKRR